MPELQIAEPPEEGEMDELSPRPYQSELLDVCLEKNTIIFLPTGSGKTYIAVVLIKRMSSSIQAEYVNGGKRSFFLVNTVALAEQQKQYIQRHTTLSVGHYTGDLNVDLWNKEKWIDQLNKNQVLVMTGQIFLDILQHDYIKLENVNLLVFDECHHAVNDHYMNKIMENFDFCPLEDQPRVVGLTATLLNANCKFNRLPEIVRELETTFRASIATIDDISQVESFSTNPDERCEIYDKPNEVPILVLVSHYLEMARDFVMSCDIADDSYAAPPLENAQPHRTGKRVSRKIANKLLDVWYHIETLGVYGGSLASLKQVIQFERILARAEDPATVIVYRYLITTLSMIRKILEDEMSGVPEDTRIYKYSTPQVLTLLHVLRDYKCDENARAIVFVERRFTAKIMFHILRAVSENIKDFSFIKPDFVVGFQNNPFNDNREGALEKKWNKQAIEKFHKGETNVLVASDVLEEGIDIPQCNLVVRYDMPKSYRSYIQSKGRARHRDSTFALLIPRFKKENILKTCQEYKNIERFLKQVLCGNQQEILNADEESNETDDREEEEEIFFAKGDARVTSNSAIALVNRYCSMLPQDKFTKLMPYWYLKNRDDTNVGFQCLLQFPINSCLRDVFEGKEKRSKKRSKQSAAFEACKALYAAGELDDHLLPLGRKTGPLSDEDELFAAYISASETETETLPGTKKCRRRYKKHFPTALRACFPTAGAKAYLHVLQMQPGYPEPPEEDTRKHSFYQLLKKESTYAILSSEPLPQLCDFPVFMNVGPVEVIVHENHQEVILSEHEITKLRHFNTMVFFDLLKLSKPYIIANLHNTENCYLIVPTVKEGEKYQINWQLVEAWSRLPKLRKPADENRLCINGNWERLKHTVVVPWYRGLPPDQIYIVTHVCYDMCPQSAFPTAAYTSFEEYYERKYELNIKNSSQPLIEVKAISNRFNCLKPRTGQTSSSRNRRQEEGDDFEEHLVPELCSPINFPACLWLKAVCLPSILHRLHHLLLAEELRQQVAHDLQLLSTSGTKWNALTIDQSSDHVEDSNKSKQFQGGYPGDTVSCISGRPSDLCTWSSDEEPIDIDRERIEDVTLMDIRHYNDFISKPLYEKLEANGKSMREESNKDLFTNEHTFSPREVSTIGILQVKLENNPGPQLAEVFQALTCASSNDALNMERLETLGDSFLKFTGSLFLFQQYPQLDEGKLTQVKGKLVGNRNLFYNGRNRGIPGKLKVHEFSPKSDWVPPSFCVPSELQERLQQVEVCPSLLFELFFKREEQESGKLSSDSEEQWRSLLEEGDTPEPSTNSLSESLISLQTIPDKVVADAVEAILGAYLRGYGVDGALYLLGWFRILPPKYAVPEWLFAKLPSCSPYICPPSADIEERVRHHLPDHDAEQLETKLGYRFQDRGYLLQALSHASYVQNRVTDCYQRLEFLGDALLDFLITCHVFEKCGQLTPGELTDLRSALVNNITFGSLAVRHEFHKFCRYDSSKLFDKVDTFVRFQEQHNHCINQEVLLLLEEKECKNDPIGESVDVPKVLGDLFESLAGAIYLDSGKSLDTVWAVYSHLMKKEIEEFSHNVPKQPVRLLYEKCNPRPVFQKAHALKDHEKVMVELEVIVRNEKRRYYGVSENKAEAKRTAAKLALKDLL